MPKRTEKAAGDDKTAKVKYVRRQGQTRKHHCHWPGCNRQVPPAMWGCYRHWMMLPKRLRDAIWATFRPGQETNGTPSREYVRVARKVQEWIAANMPGKVYLPPGTVKE